MAPAVRGCTVRERNHGRVGEMEQRSSLITAGSRAQKRREGRGSDGREKREERECSPSIREPTSEAAPPPTPLVKCLWKHHHRYTEVYVTNIFDFSPSSKVAKVNKGHPLVSNYLMHFRVE